MKKIVSRLLIGLIAMMSLSSCQTSSQTSDTTDTNTYTVTWLNYDGSVLEIDNDVSYGSMPTYDSDTPIRENDGEYSYAFYGWSPQLSKIVENVTYVAQFIIVEPYVKLIDPSTNIYVGNTIQLSYESKFLNPNDFIWESNDTSIATISPSGLLTAKNEGDVEITLSNGKFSDSIVLNIDYEPLDGFSFDFNGTSYIVTNYNGADATISIPTSYDGKPVTGIATGAFSNCWLDSVFIPSEIITIDANAFYNAGSPILYCDVTKKPGGWDSMWNSSNCTVIWNSYKGIYGSYNNFSYVAYKDEYSKPYLSITKYSGGVNPHVEVPSEINVEGEKMIVKNLDGTFDGNKTISQVFIPNSVTTIGDKAFYSCSNLTTVTISENSQLTTIGDNAFSYCSSLTSIYIPDSVTTIGDNAFYGCSSLTSIYIPDSVTSIGYNAFS